MAFHVLLSHVMAYGALCGCLGAGAWLACVLPRARYAGPAAAATQGRGLSVRAQAALVAPLWALGYVLLCSWRGYEATFFHAQLSLTAGALRWAHFVWGCGGLFWLLSGRLSARGGAFGAAEWFFSQGALLVV